MSPRKKRIKPIVGPHVVSLDAYHPDPAAPEGTAPARPPREAPAPRASTPAQQLAWRALWTRLLRPKEPDRT